MVNKLINNMPPSATAISDQEEVVGNKVKWYVLYLGKWMDLIALESNKNTIGLLLFTELWKVLKMRYRLICRRRFMPKKERQSSLDSWNWWNHSHKEPEVLISGTRNLAIDPTQSVRGAVDSTEATNSMQGLSLAADDNGSDAEQVDIREDKCVGKVR